MEIFERTESLIGSESLQKLKDSTVAVFGIGGVGSFAAEALARCGVGSLVLIDGDVIRPSNINRQIHATIETVGRPKVEVMKERLLQVNPEINVKTHMRFVLPEEVECFINDRTCYIIDAIDTISTKISIAETAYRMHIPAISSMGAGNKLEPARFKVADIYDTSTDPIAKIMRKELKKRGIPSLKVVYSDEKPLTNRRPPASISFVPPVAGLIMAGEAVRDLIQRNNRD
jgi:tRNA A37 threonylcarbamoyladenosine dehydratase